MAEEDKSKLPARLPSYLQRRRCVDVQGKASNYICVRCMRKPARDWAHVHTESGEDPWADFVPLCRSCHIKYDGHGHNGGNSPEGRVARNHSGAMKERWQDPEYRQRMSDAHKGNRAANRKLSDSDVRQVRIMLQDLELSYEVIGNRFGVSRHTIRGIDTEWSYKDVR
jgi:hypothetical protein